MVTPMAHNENLLAIPLGYRPYLPSQWAALVSPPRQSGPAGGWWMPVSALERWRPWPRRPMVSGESYESSRASRRSDSPSAPRAPTWVSVLPSSLTNTNEGWLAGNIVAGPDGSIGVDHMRKSSDIEVGYEVIDRSGVVAASHSDEVDPVGVILVHLCDRRGFGAARRSPGGPEPQDGVLALDRVPFELPAPRRGRH